jgi:class 3 adenylate cyclase
MEVVVPFYEYVRVATRDIPQHYVYTFHIYPSSEFEDEYKTQTPLILTVVVAGTFLLMTVAFVTYDRFVRRRNDMVVGAAARSNAIVSSLFPSNVRERLFREAENANAPKATEPGTTSRFNSFINAEDNPDNVLMYTTKPIADLFPDTTILFADISGFTAWSSMREPTQVFILLETIYKAFDDIAKRRRVFKVETVGDCYVAVTGLPDPCKDHALVMARFARDCMHRMRVLVRNLELSLGPDTADLSMRFGLHSGPVTAGVLRGERSRFQLFGDTMNTASRMESTGLRDRIQVSQETADLLISAGKPNWIEPRADKVIAKGKGELQTYWLYVGIHSCKSRSADTTESNVEGSQSMAPIAYTTAPAKMARLIKWNVEVMMNLIRQIEASRVRSSEHGKGEAVTRLVQPQDQTVLDEVQDIVHLPTFDGRQVQDPYSVELDLKVEEELHAYINTISSMYRENPFHCFEHASHVTMSVVKLLARIVAPDLTTEQKKSGDIASTLHDHTYGITSDPLTQFACVFSALIHDVDHTGVSNVQLSKENTKLAKFYKERSVAEQNSVDLAWNLLMNDNFQHLRQAIYETPADQQRFRHLVVNSVMATDIMDKELKDLRNARWEKAFSDGTELQEESTKEVTDRKATIVIEHLIQASDVAHTMQHWHVYRKWNERLFSELYKAYVCGRADKNPADFWAKGELGFFDYYVIPLAKKLKDCGVFGVSSEEYLNYALKNRQEWEARGEEVVAEMVQAMKAESEPSMEPIRARAPYLRSFLGSTAQSTEGPASPVKRAIRKFGSGGIPFANTGELEMGLSNINIQPRPEASSLLKTPTAVGTK